MSKAEVHYPSAGVKSAKDMANNLQKLFNEYQKIYTDNYQQITNILLDSKKVGKDIDVTQVDASFKIWKNSTTKAKMRTSSV